jgi:phosphatidyl-myo-inositol dimannoside synthase
MVTLGYPKFQGDATAPFIEGTVRSLVARGHSVDIVLPFHPEFRQSDTDAIHFRPYRYIPLSTAAPWGFGASFSARSKIRVVVTLLLPVIAAALYARLRACASRGGYDLIHANWVVPNGWVAALVSRASRLPLVVTSHGTDVAMAERSRVLGRLARRAYESADYVTATSDELRRRAVGLNAHEDRSATIYIGVDTNAFAPQSPDERVRARFGARAEDFVVVAVGRLAEVKGFQDLIAATALLNDVTTVIVGDGEFRHELARLVEGAGANVKLLGGVSHTEVPQLINAADVVVVPSIVDRSGRVDATTSTVLEALACGKPLIATTVGGIPEIVTPDINGVLVAPGDPTALAGAIDRLRGDDTLRRALSVEARRFAVERLGWSRFGDELERVFELAVEHARGKPS